MQQNDPLITFFRTTNQIGYRLNRLYSLCSNDGIGQTNELQAAYNKFVFAQTLSVAHECSMDMHLRGSPYGAKVYVRGGQSEYKKLAISTLKETSNFAGHLLAFTPARDDEYRTRTEEIFCQANIQLIAANNYKDSLEDLAVYIDEYCGGKEPKDLFPLMSDALKEITRINEIRDQMEVFFELFWNQKPESNSDDMMMTHCSVELSKLLNVFGEVKEDERCAVENIKAQVFDEKPNTIYCDILTRGIISLAGIESDLLKNCLECIRTPFPNDLQLLQETDKIFVALKTPPPRDSVTTYGISSSGNQSGTRPGGVE